MKKVLFVTTTYLDLYKDVVTELERKGFSVEYVPDIAIPGDPFDVLRWRHVRYTKNGFLAKLKLQWQTFEAEHDSLFYDYLFVIDGKNVHPYLFEILRKSNPNIKCVNYLFDRTHNVYHFERNFKYYDRVITFDRADSQRYGIEFFPLYWVQSEAVPTEKYDIFGFGAADDIRYNVFRRIRAIAEKQGYNYFLKLLGRPITKGVFAYRLRCAVKKLIGREYIPVKETYSDFFTTSTFKPEEFRSLTMGANVVVDTNHPYQDGLTARFMWALGAGCKIITTNASACNYGFYSDSQILVLNKSTNDDRIISFIESPAHVSDETNVEIDRYRIDNWLDFILFF